MKFFQSPKLKYQRKISLFTSVNEQFLNHKINKETIYFVLILILNIVTLRGVRELRGKNSKEIKNNRVIYLKFLSDRKNIK